nr:serine/threonine-protein kinase [Kofleriaceae bacterium]
MREGTTNNTAQERIARHQHAAEVLRARSVLAIAFALWLVIGVGLDLGAYSSIGTGSLGFVLAVRATSVACHGTILLVLYRKPPPPPRVANAAIAATFPITALALMLMATQMGGLASPYVSALFVGIMVQGLAWPGPWRRGAVVVGVSVAIYAGGMLVATRVDAQLAAQLADPAMRTDFIVFAAVLVAAAICVAFGGHVTWTLRQSVFESRNLGRYKLVTRIGKGGMGEVWHARDRALGREVALKILSPEHGRQPSAIARFEREIQATSEVSHPNVVRIHDWGITDDGVWYYAMDLLAGCDLSTLVARSGSMPPALVVELGRGVASGLAEAHRRGIIHRDIKPGNLFVIAVGGEPSRIELLDFGIARVSGDPELTQDGSVLGTPAFMAPEVRAGAPGSAAADAYGLAASLYFALTGKTPRDAGDRAPSELVADVPAALDDAIVRALDADPSRRPAAAELARQLDQVTTAWRGSWRVSRVMASAAPPEPDPVTDADAPATVQEPIRSRPPQD